LLNFYDRTPKRNDRKAIEHLKIMNDVIVTIDVLAPCHHHQLINVPTAGAQVFLTDYPQGELAITHHAGPVQIDEC
jgi:hypothetical protein